MLNRGFAYLDPDLGWHLRVGEEISKTLQVPEKNVYNFSYTGNWVDHEWLSNYFVYQINSHLGYQALVIFFALLIVLIFVLLNLAISYLWREKGKSPPLVLIILFQLLGVIAAMPHFGVRIQELALLFLFFVLALIYFYNKNKNWRRLLLLIPLFYLWACLHASFLIGFFIIFSWAGIKLIERLIINSRFKNKISEFVDFSSALSYREIFIFIGLSLVSFLATFFTPYYTKLYAFLLGYKDTLYLSYISEWFSQFSYPFFYWQLFYLSLGGLALLIYIYYAKKRKIDLWTLFIFLLFFFLSFKSRRHFPLFVVATFIFLVSVYSDYIVYETHSLKRLPTWLKTYLLICLFLTGLSMLLNINFVSDPFYSTAFSKDYPRKALTFIDGRRDYDNLRIFNLYDWGGFMIYDNPGRKIFIDGRLPQVAYKGHSFLAEYLEFFDSDSEIASELKEYDIKLVLLKFKEEPAKPKKWEKVLFYLKDNNLSLSSNLRGYLDKSADWQVVYKDETAIVYKLIK